MAAIIELHPRYAGAGSATGASGVPTVGDRAGRNPVPAEAAGPAQLGQARPGAFRRRRLAVVAWALLLFVGAARSVGAVADWAVGDVPPPPPTAGRLYVVQPGDTLWEIARSLQPRGDVRPLVDRLVQLNGGAEVRAGDVLELRW